MSFLSLGQHRAFIRMVVNVLLTALEGSSPVRCEYAGIPCLWVRAAGAYGVPKSAGVLNSKPVPGGPLFSWVSKRERWPKTEH